MSALPEPSWPISDGVVALRRFTVDDVSDVTRACQDPEIARWTAGIPSPYEEHHARWWIGQHDSQWAEGTQATFAFCSVADSGLLGSMAVEGIDLERRSASAGYWAAPWARNRGATTRALGLACQWAFDALHLARVELLTMAGNRASERVAEKTGFTLAGQVDSYHPAKTRNTEAVYRVFRWVLHRE